MTRSVSIRSVASATLAAAIGLALAAAPAPSARAADAAMEKMMKEFSTSIAAAKSEKCFGVALSGKNDCASADGKSSCAGSSTKNNDKAAYIVLPVGECGKIVGGSTNAA